MPAHIRSGGDRHFSEAFIYYEARALEHTANYDSGAYLRDAIKICHTKGACAESVMPYVAGDFATKPTKAALAAAKLDKTVQYSRLPQDKNSMHVVLASGLPFVIGFSVYESFMTQAVADTGDVPMPDFSRERVVGGHAVLVVGFDDTAMPDARYIVRNSWGTAWGKYGYFTIPQAYFEDNQLADDLWVVEVIK